MVCYRRFKATDPYIGLIYDRYKSDQDKPRAAEMRGLSEDARRLWHQWSRLTMSNKVLIFQWADYAPKRVILPRNTVPQIIQQLHDDVGHLGVAKTEQAARQRHWWPTMREDIQDF